MGSNISQSNHVSTGEAYSGDYDSKMQDITRSEQPCYRTVASQGKA